MSLFYEDDYVQLYHGDCREIPDWLEADVLVTDPPYGRAWRQGVVKESRYPKAMNSASRDGIAGDDDTAVRDAVLEVWGDSKPFVAFGDLMLPPPAGVKLVCVYHKAVANAGLRGAIDGVRRDAEAIYLGGRRTSGIGGRSSVFRFGGAISGTEGIATTTGHPHTKPVGLMETLITLSPPGVIADPFAGSGSTLIAARNLGRKAIGVEIEERYCEVIAKRLSQQAFDFTALEEAIS